MQTRRTPALPGATVTTPFRTSPSYVARYFFHQCDRFLRFTATRGDRQATDGVPTKRSDQSFVMQGVVDQGHAWEETVVTEMLGGAVHVADTRGALSDRYFSRADTVQMLRTVQAGEWIYQPTLRAPDIFYERYGIDPELVQFSDCRPDLLQVTEDEFGRRTVHVVDVKRGGSMKPRFQIQVLLYALLLRDVVLDADIDLAVDVQMGGVWLGGADASESFDVSQVHPHLDAFLRHELREILSTPAEDVPWHLYFRCEWCEYFEHCHAEMKQTEDISQFTLLTPRGKAVLRREHAVKSIHDMRHFLESGDQQHVDEALAKCASLAGKRPYLAAQAEALTDGRVRDHGGATHLFPLYTKREIRIYATVQWEPLADSIYLVGMTVRSHSEVPPMVAGSFASAPTRMFVARRPEDTDRVRAQFIETLSDFLEGVDAFNDGAEWNQKLSVQIIVHNPRDRDLFEQLLHTALSDDAEVAERAMRLLLYIASPELIHQGQHPKEEPVHAPIAVVLDALRRTFALPVPVSYTLPEALASLGDDSYKRVDKYLFPLGHGLRSDAIHEGWFRGDTEAVDRFVAAATLYLAAVERLYNIARARAKDLDLLADWPVGFLLPRVAEIADPLLSRLAFLCRYESVSQCRGLRDGRYQPLEVQRLLGNVHEIECVAGPDKMRVVRSAPDLQADSFQQYIMVPATRAGWNAARNFPDYHYRAKFGAAKSKDRAVVRIDHVTTDKVGVPEGATLHYITAFKDDAPAPGQRFRLYPRFSDYNADRVIAFLHRLDQAEPGLFRALVDDPASGAEAVPLPAAVAAALHEMGDLDFSPSKQRAFDWIRGHRAAAIWGPPGTGKTYFLARTIVALQRAYVAAGVRFHVLVTGFTHAAIENLLGAIVAQGGDGVCKVGPWARTAHGDIVEKGKNCIAAHTARHATAILGTTAYQLIKEERPSRGFDLVVFDESSQVRVPESAIPTSLVAADGRIVFAGDDYQLPPIVQGIYSDPEDGPALHRSIFEALLDRADDGTPQSPIVHTLLENYRMNDVLTSYARELLYPGYQSATSEIAARRIALSTAGLGELAALALDPEFPIVIGIVDGVQAAKENPVEANFVAELVVALRERLEDPETSAPYDTDRDFFDSGLFVVCPHRAQNQLVRRYLQRDRAWEHPPFVDTVDKMQGQEAQAVIVSYGVSDPEFAVMEADFIYSRNRLNVAISRARSKTIVLLSRHLIQSMPSVLEHPSASVGLAYMRRIIEHLRRDGDSHVFDLGEGRQMELLRTGVTWSA